MRRPLRAGPAPPGDCRRQPTPPPRAREGWSAAPAIHPGPTRSLRGPSPAPPACRRPGGRQTPSGNPPRALGHRRTRPPRRLPPQTTAPRRRNRRGPARSVRARAAPRPSGGDRVCHRGTRRARAAAPPDRAGPATRPRFPAPRRSTTATSGSGALGASRGRCSTHRSHSPRRRAARGSRPDGRSRSRGRA